MLNDLLYYNLKIFQNENYFKYSIDSVLLAEFVNINLKTKNILDLCTGNAPIPLVLSTKTDKNIYGVELQKNIYELGVKSVEFNKIKNIKLINDDVKNILNTFDFKFDIITCNPPYFKVHKNSILNKNDILTIARHEVKINLEDIISISSKLINHSGSLYLVHRCDRLIEIFSILKKYNFGLRRLQFVYNNKSCDSCFILIEAKYLCKDDLKVLKPLFVEDYLDEK